MACFSIALSLLSATSLGPFIDFATFCRENAGHSPSELNLAERFELNKEYSSQKCWHMKLVQIIQGMKMKSGGNDSLWRKVLKAKLITSRKAVVIAWNDHYRLTSSNPAPVANNRKRKIQFFDGDFAKERKLEV